MAYNSHLLRLLENSKHQGTIYVKDKRIFLVPEDEYVENNMMVNRYEDLTDTKSGRKAIREVIHPKEKI